MIAYLKGKIIYKGANYVAVGDSAVGYKVFAKPDLIERKKEGDEAEFFIYHLIREDTDDLYGFDSPSELKIFELLLGVSGVGPKVALAIIGTLGQEKFTTALAKSDSNAFRAVSGVGTKVAAKIIVELKGKASGDIADLMGENDETLEALTSLGYKRQEIIPYLSKIPEDKKTVQEKIKYVLAHVGKNK